VPGFSAAQGLLDFRKDLAFDATTVESVAERAYRSRLRTLAADDRLDTDLVLLARVRGILARLRIAGEFERPDTDAVAWEIHTCRRCNENASAMAGGKLLIGEEFIAGLALTDDELAYMVAHEMAHVLAEHTREFATTARFFVSNGQNRHYGDIQKELDESIVVNMRMAPVYNMQEFEADYMGFILGARSGYDPEAMLRMLIKLHMRAGSDAGPFGLHPDALERILRVQAVGQAMRRVYEIGVPAR
jgi:predicted Zn-dependent protease